MAVLHLGYLISCNLAPNRRLSSREAIKDFFDNVADYGDAPRIAPLYIDADNEVGGYTLDITKRYFDAPFADTLPRDGYNYGLLYEVPVQYESPEDIPKTPNVIINADWNPVPQAYFFFVIGVEHNSIDSTMYRVYYTIDWWTTCVYLEMPPTIEGEAIRAHVNDITLSSARPIFTNFTDEAELSVPANDVVTRAEMFRGQDIVIENPETAPSMKASDFAFLVFTLKNASGVTYGKRNNDVAFTFETNYGSSLFENALGLTFVMPIYMRVSGSPIAAGGDNAQTEMFNIDDIVDDRFLSMYVTHTVNLPITIVVTADKKFTHTVQSRDAAKIQYADGKFLWAYPYEGTFRNLLQSMTPELSDMDIYNIGTDLNEPIAQVLEKSPKDGFEIYLDKLVIKAHSYPYSYYSAYSSGLEVTFSQAIQDVVFMGFYREGSTGTYVLYSTSQSDAYKTPKMTHYFYNTGVFAPYFSENWLTRLNALDEASHSKVMSIEKTINGAVESFTSAATSFGSAAASAATGNVVGTMKGLSGGINAAVGGITGLVEDTTNSVYVSRIADRTIKAYNEGYLQQGSVPTQATSGLSGDNEFYLIGNTITPEVMKSIKFNLHLFGTTTKLNLYYILRDHLRQHFNFVCAGRINVIPTGSELVNANYNAQIIADITGMFMNGVFLIHDHHAERSLLISNLEVT